MDIYLRWFSFAVSWMPTIIASFEWKRMNSKAAISSMLAGTISFILLGELERAKLIQFITLNSLINMVYSNFLIFVLCP